MNRLVLVVTVLAGLAGCVDQQSTDTEELGSTEQNVAGTLVIPTQWVSRLHSSLADMWDLNQPSGTWSRQMVVITTQGEPAVACGTATTCTGALPETRFVWLFSNQRLFRLYEVNVGDLAEFHTTRSGLYANFEGAAHAAGFSSVNDGVVTGDYTPGTAPVGPRPPRGFPIAVATTMANYAGQFRTLIQNVPNLAGTEVPVGP